MSDLSRLFLGLGMAATVACGSSESATAPTESPFPLLASVKPDTALAGSSSATITLTGSGFVATSTVLVSGIGVPTTYRSSSELTATLSVAQLATTGTLGVRVSNPPPGGGASATFSIAVRNPAPAIASLSPATIDAGVSGATVQVNGTGFVRNSVVQARGVARPTTFVSSTQLSVALDTSDATQPGSTEIRVVNPTPGGGTSAPAQLTVVATQPILTRLPVSGAHTGSPGFALAVDGQRFTPSSVVTWNGSDRPTTFISGTRLTATIGASDVTSPGVVQIGVRTPGVAPSTTLPLTIRALGAATVTELVTVPLPVQDVVYDPGTDRMYASISPAGGGNANSVVAIDPHTGQITGSVFVGTDPRRIIRSDDGQYLYVTVNADTSVRRVQISPLAAQLQFSVDAGMLIEDVQVMPGANRTLAIVRSSIGYTQGVRLYDEDRVRPKWPTGFQTINVIAFADASTLYGFNNENTGDQFYTLGVDASGLTITNTAVVFNLFATYFLYAAGRVYATSGAIGDPERHVQLARFPATGPIVVEPERGRAYINTGSGTIAVFDLSNQQPLGSVTVPSAGHISPVPRHPIRWGDDGLAFTDGSALHIFKTGLAAP